MLPIPGEDDERHLEAGLLAEGTFITPSQVGIPERSRGGIDDPVAPHLHGRRRGQRQREKPMTVAGPRRIRTGFPNTSGGLITSGGEGQVKKNRGARERDWGRRPKKVLPGIPWVPIILNQTPNRPQFVPLERTRPNHAPHLVSSAQAGHFCPSTLDPSPINGRGSCSLCLLTIAFLGELGVLAVHLCLLWTKAG